MITFSLDKDNRYLEWSFQGDRPVLSEEEARIIANAETAEALRGLLGGLHAIADAIREKGSGAAQAAL